MALPSRLMGSGVGAQAAQNICGDVATGLTATGTTAADAYQLAAAINQFSTVGSGAGAKLMPTESGASVIVRNSGANTLTLYPATGSTINGASSVAVYAATTVVVFATAGTTWFALAAGAAGAAGGVFTTLSSTGNTDIGNAASDLIGFHGATAVDQYAFIASASIVALISGSVVGFTTSASLSNVIEKLNAVLALLSEKGLMAAS